MGWTSLFVRRLRDARLLSILGLLPYGWCILFWLLTFGVSSSEREGIVIFASFGCMSIMALIVALCLFPTKQQEHSSWKQEVFQSVFLRSGINLWKNIFKFRAPYRTGRREFFYSLIWFVVFYFVSFLGTNVDGLEVVVALIWIFLFWLYSLYLLED